MWAGVCRVYRVGCGCWVVWCGGVVGVGGWVGGGGCECDWVLWGGGGWGVGLVVWGRGLLVLGGVGGRGVLGLGFLGGLRVLVVLRLEQEAGEIGRAHV